MLISIPSPNIPNSSASKLDSLTILITLNQTAHSRIKAPCSLADTNFSFHSTIRADVSFEQPKYSRRVLSKPEFHRRWCRPFSLHEKGIATPSLLLPSRRRFFLSDALQMQEVPFVCVCSKLECFPVLGTGKRAMIDRAKWSRPRRTRNHSFKLDSVKSPPPRMPINRDNSMRRLPESRGYGVPLWVILPAREDKNIT